MSTTLTTLMSLPVPVVGSEPGPTWASDLNSCMSILDGHNHSPGAGASITPAGISINADLPYNSNNAITLRSARFTTQASPLALSTDKGCIYESGVDLYYNDGNGVQIRLTQSGGISGTPGSIAGLTSPASATFNAGSGTFIWQSAAATAASMDCGTIYLRKTTASSAYIALTAAVGLASNYTLTLPSAPPASTKILTMDSSGNVGITYDVDNSTLQVSSSIISVKDAGVTRPKLVAVGEQVSSSSGAAGYSGTSYADITNLTVTITTTGRPVIVGVIPDGGASGLSLGQLTANGSVGSTSEAFIQIQRGGVTVGVWKFQTPGVGGEAIPILTCGSLVTLDVPGASTYTYTAQYKITGGSAVGVQAQNAKLFAYEL